MQTFSIINHPHQTPTNTGALPSRSVHRICGLVERIAFKLAVTIIFLASLVKFVWVELELPPIPWDQLIAIIIRLFK